MARPTIPNPTDEDPLPRGVYRRARADGSVTWGARWHDARGKEHRKAASPNTKAAALKLYRKMKHLADEGKLPAQPITMTLGKLLASYLPQLVAERESESGARDDNCRFRYWSATFGDYALPELTRNLLANWRAAYLRTHAPASAQRMLAWLRAVLNRAVDDGHLPANPAARLKTLRFANARIRYLTDEEETALEAACPLWLWEMVLFAIETGLRRGEMFRLRWDRVDLARHVLTVPRSKKHGEARHLPTYTVDHLLQKWKPEARTPWVFPSTTGKTFRDPDKLYERHFRPACIAAGLADLTWHDLRRTFISRLVMAGEDLRTVMELAGHKRIEMTMRYAQLAPGRTHQAMARARNRRANRHAEGAGVGESES